MPRWSWSCGCGLGSEAHGNSSSTFETDRDKRSGRLRSSCNSDIYLGINNKYSGCSDEALYHGIRQLLQFQWEKDRVNRHKDNGNHGGGEGITRSHKIRRASVPTRNRASGLNVARLHRVTTMRCASNYRHTLSRTHVPVGELLRLKYSGM